MRRVVAVAFIVGIVCARAEAQLPNTDIAALTFSFTPHTSEKGLRKAFVFGFTLNRKTPNTTPGQAK